MAENMKASGKNILSLATIQRVPWQQRGDVFALVIDPGIIEDIESRKTGIKYKVLKMSVTDPSHPGMHVCFWCDAAVRTCSKGSRTGDIVKLIKVNESANSKEKKRYGQQLTAREAIVVWRDGKVMGPMKPRYSPPKQNSYLDKQIHSESQNRNSHRYHHHNQHAENNEGLSLQGSFDNVVQWAKSAWPGICKATPQHIASIHLTPLSTSTSTSTSMLPSIAGARSLVGGDDIGKVDQNVSNNTSYIWQKAVQSHQTDVDLLSMIHNETPSELIKNCDIFTTCLIPRFYSVDQLFEMTHHCHHDLIHTLHHNNFHLFRGCCEVRCVVSRLWLPPSAQSLSNAINDATESMSSSSQINTYHHRLSDQNLGISDQLIEVARHMSELVEVNIPPSSTLEQRHHNTKVGSASMDSSLCSFKSIFVSIGDGFNDMMDDYSDSIPNKGDNFDRKRKMSVVKRIDDDEEDAMEHNSSPTATDGDQVDYDDTNEDDVSEEDAEASQMKANKMSKSGHNKTQNAIIDTLVDGDVVQKLFCGLDPALVMKYQNKFLPSSLENEEEEEEEANVLSQEHQQCLWFSLAERNRVKNRVINHKIQNHENVPQGSDVVKNMDENETERKDTSHIFAAARVLIALTKEAIIFERNKIFYKKHDIKNKTNKKSKIDISHEKEQYQHNEEQDIDEFEHPFTHNSVLWASVYVDQVQHASLEDHVLLPSSLGLNLTAFRLVSPRPLVPFYCQ